eukprot:6204744-Pleurochrysis_carterae.AAC.3
MHVCPISQTCRETEGKRSMRAHFLAQLKRLLVVTPGSSTFECSSSSDQKSSACAREKAGCAWVGKTLVGGSSNARTAQLLT